MNARKPLPLRKSSLVHIVLLVVCASLCFILYFHPHLNTVVGVYYQAGVSFLAGQNPYALFPADSPSAQYLYSPAFALLMGGMAALGGPDFFIRGWPALGIAVFIYGLLRWSDSSKPVPFYTAFAVLACIIEIEVSTLLALQANALMIGLVLIGLAEFRDGRQFCAGLILLLAASLKVYPAVFIIALAFRSRRAFWRGILTAAATVFLLPACFVGWSFNLATHLAWLPAAIKAGTRTGCLDIFSALQRAGWEHTAFLARLFISGISVPLFMLYAFFARSIDWRPWITFGVASILLLNRRTEVPTFVLLAPSYVFMVLWSAESENRIIKSYAGIVFTLLALRIALCRYLDPLWFVSENPAETARVMGVLGFWIISGSIIAKDMFAGNRPQSVSLEDEEIDRRQCDELRPPSFS